MKTKHFLLALMLTVALVACSDGTPPENVNPDVVSAAKQAEQANADAAANPAEAVLPAPKFTNLVVTPEAVPMGGTATLSWSVQETTRVEVEMQYEDGTVEKMDSFGSEAQEIKVENHRKNVTFKFSAIKDLAAAASEEKESSEEKTMTTGEEEEVTEEEKIEQKSSDPEQTVGSCTKGMEACVTTAERTVIVIGSTPVEIECYAQETEIELGESTMIFWETNPQEETIVQISASPEGDPIQLTDCEAESMDAAIVEGELIPYGDDGLTGYPAKGCAVVRPDTSTTYTISARNENYQPSSCTIDVGIEGEIPGPIPQPPSLSIEDFSTNGDSDGEYSVNNYPANGVVISWRAIPTSATVTMTADPAGNVTVGDGALPTEGASQGSVTLNVTGDVRLTLTARIGESVAVKAINIVSSGIQTGSGFDSTKVRVQGPGSFVFSGETAKVTWETDPAYASKITKTKLMSPAGVEVASAASGSGMAEFPVETGGLYTLVLESSGQIVMTDKPIAVSIQVLEVREMDGQKAVRTVSSGDTTYVGLDLGYSGGALKILKQVGKKPAQVVSIPFLSEFKKWDEFNSKLNPQHIEAFETFPVNAIAVVPGEEEGVFVGTTGGIFYNGKMFAPMRLFDVNSDYEGHRPTCFGNTQKGRKGVTKGDLVALGQVCDLALNEKTLFVANDGGLLIYNDISCADKPKKCEAKWDETLYGSVLNDVEVAKQEDGSTVVYVAGAKGVYKSSDNGTTWEDMGAGSIGVVNSLTVGSDGKVTAGSDSGVFTYNGTTWDTVGLASELVYSVMVDGSGTVYAGTANGLKIKRSGETDFKVIPVGGEGVPVRSIANASATREDGAVTFGVRFATEGGTSGGDIIVGMTQPTPPATEEPASETPAASELSATGSVTQ